MNMKTNLAHEPPILQQVGEVVQFPNKEGETVERRRKDPLVPSNVDLRDFAYMPLDVVRFRDSDFAALIDGEAFRAGVLLWCASWHQVPAGSLPADDRVLANLAGFGRYVAEWQKVKEAALHGWIECSDGRLYHPVICEKALESWSSKQQHQYARFADRMRKANKKLDAENKPQIEIPEIDTWISKGCPKDWNRNSISVPQEFQQPSSGIPEEFHRNSNGNYENSTGNSEFSAGKENFSAGIPQNSELKGKGNIRDINNSSSGSSTREEKFSAQRTQMGFVRYYTDDLKHYTFDELMATYSVEADFDAQARHVTDYPNITDEVIYLAFQELSTWGAQAEKKTAHRWMATFLSKFVQQAYHSKPVKQKKDDFQFGDLAYEAMQQGGYRDV